MSLWKTPICGNLFENFIISDLIKENYNQGRNLKFWFWRDNHKNEIDLLFETVNGMRAIEIKSGETFRNDFIKNLIFWAKLTNNDPKNFFLVYGGNENFIYNDINIIKWLDASRILT